MLKKKVIEIYIINDTLEKNSYEDNRIEEITLVHKKIISAQMSHQN